MQSFGCPLCAKSRHSALRQGTSLFDHLVGSHLHDQRHGKIEPLGGLEVDHELEFGGLHDWQVGRFLALEDAAGVDADLPMASVMLLP